MQNLQILLNVSKWLLHILNLMDLERFNLRCLLQRLLDLQRGFDF